MTQAGEPVHPAMYADAGDGTLDLLFLECGRCGALSFPSSVYGCRECGAPADAGRTARRPGKATLRQFLTVHQNLVASLPAPYVVGDLELAPGLIEESVLGVDDESGLAPGMLMKAVPVPAEEGRYTCRFVPAGEDA